MLMRFFEGNYTRLIKELCFLGDYKVAFICVNYQSNITNELETIPHFRNVKVPYSI